MQNALLHMGDLPPFSQIQAEQVVPAIQELCGKCQGTIESGLAQGLGGWTLFQKIEEAEDGMARAWSAVSHLHNVADTPELRKAHEKALALISEYETWRGQHQGLYEATKALKEGPEFPQLKGEQQSSIDKALLHFELSGIGLPEKQKKRYGEISKRLAELGTQFSNNLLDATMGWTKLIEREEELAGLPDSAKTAAAELAISKGMEGWLFDLTIPSYLPVMTYSENREFRREIYEAYSTRASDQGPQKGKWDNSPLMEEILQLRAEKARLLGFQSHSEVSLALKMAETPQQVLDFLNDLVQRARPQGLKERETLQAFAKEEDGLKDLQPWDYGYYAERYKQKLFKVDNEMLRPYFPEDTVFKGLCELVKRLFGMEIREQKGVDTWNEAVRFFHIYDPSGTLRGSFYLDLYAREHKRGGAWMDTCRSRRRRMGGEIQSPVAFLTCNFNRPGGGKPALFTHREVMTLFHEFGHGIHHMFTRVETAAVAGINGVPWDAVELPSQFLENWCWEEEALQFISGHYETGEPLPGEILENTLKARNYNSAMFLLRQLEFGLFDFTLHTSYDPALGGRVMETLRAVREKVAVAPSADWDRFPHGFAHIFASGYSAGYYSYLWAEVLSSDAYSRFEEEGIFNPTTGRSFLENILELGGSQDPLVLFKNFRGREPRIDALLRHKGILS